MFVLTSLLGVAFLVAVTWASYRLGKTRTDNAKAAALIGFLLCFIPPFAVIYLAVLLLKPEVDVV